jgi:hypothetical protein
MNAVCRHLIMLIFNEVICVRHIVNVPRITTLINCLILTSLFAFFFVFNLQVDDRLTSGAFTIDSSTPTLTGNFSEHPIQCNQNTI